MAVLNPVTKPDTALMQDTDLAGPLVFCLAFGGSLLLVGNCCRLKNRQPASVTLCRCLEFHVSYDEIRELLKVELL